MKRSASGLFKKPRDPILPNTKRFTGLKNELQPHGGSRRKYSFERRFFACKLEILACRGLVKLTNLQVGASWWLGF